MDDVSSISAFGFLSGDFLHCTEYISLNKNPLPPGQVSVATCRASFERMKWPSNSKFENKRR